MDAEITFRLNWVTACNFFFSLQALLMDNSTQIKKNSLLNQIYLTCSIKKQKKTYVTLTPNNLNASNYHMKGHQKRTSC